MESVGLYSSPIGSQSPAQHHLRNKLGKLTGMSSVASTMQGIKRQPNSGEFTWELSQDN